MSQLSQHDAGFPLQIYQNYPFLDSEPHKKYFKEFISYYFFRRFNYPYSSLTIESDTALSYGMLNFKKDGLIQLLEQYKKTIDNLGVEGMGIDAPIPVLETTRNDLYKLLERLKENEQYISEHIVKIYKKQALKRDAIVAQNPYTRSLIVASKGRTMALVQEMFFAKEVVNPAINIMTQRGFYSFNMFVALCVVGTSFILNEQRINPIDPALSESETLKYLIAEIGKMQSSINQKLLKMLLSEKLGALPFNPDVIIYPLSKKQRKRLKD